MVPTHRSERGMVLGAAFGVTRLPFVKVESIGNDFVLIDEGETGPLDWSSVAVQVCARRVSIGSDGLLVVGRQGRELTQRMFNPDGTEDFCGNGLRCTAWYAHQRGWVKNETVIHHVGRAIPVTIDGEGLIATTLGPASFAPAAVPVAASHELWDHTWASSTGKAFQINALTTGSTHTVVFVDHLPPTPEFETVSAELEHEALFPARTSVIWTKVESERRLAIRIWERGVGETLGCGTGSSAAVAATIRKTGEGGDYRVANPGGDVVVSAAQWDEPLRVVGKAQVVFEGEVLVRLDTGR